MLCLKLACFFVLKGKKEARSQFISEYQKYHYQMYAVIVKQCLHRLLIIAGTLSAMNILLAKEGIKVY